MKVKSTKIGRQNTASNRFESNHRHCVCRLPPTWPSSLSGHRSRHDDWCMHHHRIDRRATCVCVSEHALITIRRNPGYICASFMQLRHVHLFFGSGRCHVLLHFVSSSSFCIYSHRASIVESFSLRRSSDARYSLRR